MKSNDNMLDTRRFYEITAVKEGDCWYEKPGTDFCIEGAIIQPTSQLGRFTIVKACPSGYLSGSINESIYFGSDGCMTLRPLNEKDQAKLQRKRDQFCG